MVIFSGVSASASADEWAWNLGGDGNQLITSCKSAVQKLDEPSRVFTQQEVYYIGYCDGFVSGIADSPQTQSDANLMGVPRGQLERVVVKYLEDHPEKLSLASSFLVREALIKAFPKVRKGK
jgi:hypothetical protein